MMFLSRIALVNWHIFPRADLDLSGNAAILGKNRSGKSTLIDLVQAVMTGGAGNLYRFNRSAGEGGTRSERTLRGYCLGQLDQHVARREESVTHIALVFEDPTKNRKPVTLGLCLQARRNEDVQTSGRYVAEGIAVDSSLFVEEHATGRRSAPWALVRARLEEACRQADGQLHQHPSAARTYIREYMRLLFTNRRSPDPDRFIKAFILALSFEDMRSVEDFVRNYLLERNDIDIAELRDSIQRYRQIQKDIQELERKLAALQLLHAEIERFSRLLDEETLAASMLRLAWLLDAGKALFGNLDARRMKRDALATTEAEILRIAAELDRVEKEHESLRAQAEASGIEGRRHGLRQEIELVDRERTDLLKRLHDRHRLVARAIEILKQRERLKDARLGELLSVLETIEKQSDGLTPPQWPRDPGAMEKLVSNAAQTAREKLPRLEHLRNESLVYLHQCERQIDDIKRRMAESSQGRVSLHPNTTALMEVLRKHGLQPRALCQVLEVLDEGWRDAAEALLGRDRETVIVDPEHAEQAVSLLRREKDRFRGCRVANTRKLSSLPDEPAGGTLASTLRSDDPLAMAFIVFRLGNVRLAETQDDLFRSGRAIMRDGTYDDGIVIEVRRPDGLKIGRVAAELMIELLQRDLQEQQQLADVHRQTVRVRKDACDRLALLTTPLPESEHLEILTASLAEADERRADLDARLERATLLIDPALHEGITKAKKRISLLQEEEREYQRSRGALQAEIRSIELRLAAGETEIGSWFRLKHRRERFRETVPNFASFSRVRKAYAERRVSQSHARFAQEMQEEARRLSDERHRCDADIREKLVAYCLTFAAPRQFDRDSKILTDIKPWLAESIAILEDNELIRYRRQADQAAERITHLFRSSFIHELNSRFRNLETEMEDLRSALRSKQLHGEVYSLHAHIRPEFRGLYDLARDSENNELLLSPLFSHGLAADHPHTKALAEIERLLQDEGLNFEIYQDYRNYFAFDLRMRDVANGRETSYDRRRGVASGAERQVPFYVIIGAALASIYHGAQRGINDDGRGMGLAVFDEAFSKMDGPNQRTMLHFYNEIGLQVLIAAPTEKRAVVYENLDSIVDVYRFGDEAEAEVSHIRPHAREAMRAANPQHLSDEELRVRLDLSAAQAPVK
jgi:hypothetical protein